MGWRLPPLAPTALCCHRSRGEEAVGAIDAVETARLKIWLDRLRAVTRDEVLGILMRVPENRMSAICRDFTVELLETNRQRLLESGTAE